MPSQTAFDFNAPDEGNARVWLWCAYLMSVESDAAHDADDLEHDAAHCARGIHAETRCTCPETWARIDELRAAGDRFYAKAAEVAGRPMTDADWTRAIDALGES